MPKKNVTTRLEEKQLRQVGHYLKTRRPAETVRAALDFVAEKAAHEKVVKKYSGVGEPDAFQDSHNLRQSRRLEFVNRSKRLNAPQGGDYRNIANCSSRRSSASCC